MVLALSYHFRDSATQWTDEKYQGIVIFDMRSKRFIDSQNNSAFKQSFSTILFTSNKELVY